VRAKRNPKTQKQIDAEIAALREIKPRVPRYTGFGDDNWKKIDVQIAVLERDMDEDDISGIVDADENSIAYETIQWRDGNPVDEEPTASWKCIANPKARKP
jgi:hypothetical protein